jgi:branched-chain amino acid aminotransferase
VAREVGDGVFETVKVVGGRPFALGRHLARLRASAAALGLPEPDDEELRARVAAAVAEAAPLMRVRLTWAFPGVAVAVAAPTQPPAAAAYVVTSPWPRNERGPLSGHKTTAYADEVVALAHAREQGADEALLADQRGRLSEGTASNVFYVVDGELRTPSLATGCLPGITRALVLEWWGAVETDAPLAEVRRGASEVFLTSSLRDVQPVRRWDDGALEGPGEVTRQVMARWRDLAPELVGR